MGEIKRNSEANKARGIDEGSAAYDSSGMNKGWDRSESGDTNRGGETPEDEEAKANAISDSRFGSESISIIEANIDDQTPQALAFAVDKLFAAGALDVIVVAATMKKSRSGHLLSVLCKPEDECRLQELVIIETSSLGARVIRAKRLLAERKFATVTMTDGSSLRIKLACDRNGEVVNAHPEFEDLAKYAMIQEVSLKEANARAIAAFAQQKREE